MKFTAELHRILEISKHGFEWVIISKLLLPEEQREILVFWEFRDRPGPAQFRVAAERGLQKCLKKAKIKITLKQD